MGGASHMLFLVISHLVFVTFLIWLVIMVVVTFVSDCSMDPWSPILLLNHYSSLYWIKILISESILFLIIFVFLCTNASWWSSSLALIGALLMTGIIPLIGQSNNNVAGLGRPGPRGVDLTCNKARHVLALVLLHFLSVHFMNLMHAFSIPLLWWYYKDDTVFSMFRFLQNSFKFLKQKYHLHLTLFSCATHTLKKWPYMLVLSCIPMRSCWLKWFLMVFPISYGEWFSLWDVFAEHQDMLNSFFTIFSISVFMCIQ